MHTCLFPFTFSNTECTVVHARPVGGSPMANRHFIHKHKDSQGLQRIETGLAEPQLESAAIELTKPKFANRSVLRYCTITNASFHKQSPNPPPALPSIERSPISNFCKITTTSTRLLRNDGQSKPCSLCNSVFKKATFISNSENGLFKGQIRESPKRPWSR